MAASAARSKRLVTAVGVLIAVGLSAALAQSRSVQTPAEIQLVTAGPGTVTIAPAEFDPSAVCEVDAQQDNGNCVHHFEEGTTVTLSAEP